MKTGLFICQDAQRKSFSNLRLMKITSKHDDMKNKEPNLQAKEWIKVSSSHLGSRQKIRANAALQQPLRVRDQGQFGSALRILPGHRSDPSLSGVTKEMKQNLVADDGRGPCHSQMVEGMPFLRQNCADAAICLVLHHRIQSPSRLTCCPNFDDLNMNF